MIPKVGCDPNRNIITLGAKIIERLSSSSSDVDNLLLKCSEELSVSMDHIMISLDWLFMIGVIDFCDNEVFLNEAD